eukprot:TRINITY_DN57974_c0_g1_i1.p1 TRINITY_DN57974_c0_g1~~TRINITY_DN57974_c0_g1_i1.p1  ORF type:complete len:570 (-),score=63.62 TRINITY_DN57974_c0_g1_i1:5-1714(-)
MISRSALAAVMASDPENADSAVSAAFAAAGRWYGPFCYRGGAMVHLNEFALAVDKGNPTGNDDVETPCWWHAMRGWTSDHRFKLMDAWTLSDDAHTLPSASDEERARERCRSIGSAWDLKPIVFDLPRYVRDLRTCVRSHRDDLTEAVNALHTRLHGLFSKPRRLYLCVPARWCDNADHVASGPVREIMGYFETIVSHANASAWATAGGGAALAGGRGAVATEWVTLFENGRLGNMLVDLINALAIAVRTRRKGVLLESGAASGKHSNSTDALFGKLFGVAVEVPRQLRRVLPRMSETAARWGRCKEDNKYATHLTATRWSTKPHHGPRPPFPSCALPLAVRQQLLRGTLLPRMRVRGKCRAFMGRSDAKLAELGREDVDVLTIHLRGGDTIPPGTPDHAQPPCAAYEHAFESGGVGGGSFRRLRIVAEDAKNPCLAHLLARYPDKVLEARVAGNLVEDLCLLMSATNLFVSASTFTANLVLLGRAARVFTPLPSVHFTPGLPYFGLDGKNYLRQLCGLFERRVVGYSPAWSYYMGDVSNDDKGVFFDGIPASRILNYPLKDVQVKRCK